MIKVLLGLVLSFVAVLAQAQTIEKYFRTTPSNGKNLSNTDIDVVCKHAITEYRAFNGSVQAWTYYGASGNPASNSSGGCLYRLPPSTSLLNNGTWTKLNCTAALPFFDNGTQKCVAAPPPPPPPVCPAGVIKSYTYRVGTVGADGSLKTDYSPAEDGASDGVCEVRITGVEKCYSLPPAPETYCRYTTSTTGVNKMPSEGVPSPAGAPPTGATDARKDVPPFRNPQGSCPAGTVQGGVAADGVPVCMGTGTAPKSTPPPPPKLETTKTEATPDGGSKTTDTSVTSNSDGSKTTTTTTTTTGADGSKAIEVVKTTSATPAGNDGKDETAKQDEKYDLCKQNPMLAMCRNSSVTGACEAITCDGDAIQCATLRAAAAMECRDKKNQEELAASSLVTAGERILSGADTTAADFAKGSVVDMSKQNLDQSGFVAGSCLANRSFTVSGHTVQMSFAQVCDKIQPLRAVVMACAFIISYLIVSRSVIQG